MRKLFLAVFVLQTVLAYAQTQGQSNPSKGVLLTIDVSGKEGQQGQDGFSFGRTRQSASSGTGFFMNSMVAGALGTAGDIIGLVGGGGGSGSDGRRGGDAGPATVGTNAGQMSVKLSSGASDGKFNGVVIVEANLLESNGGSQNPKFEIQYGSQGYLYLYAKGGKGGDGGNGGDGEPGKPGAPGRNATRHIPGGSGGRGGDGGDGGNATSGAQGGLGGKIEITVHEKEAALFMLVDPNVEGGIGGKAGENGRGGQGGEGGPGGASAMGSDTKTRTVSDGNGGSRTETYQEPWFMPGGSDGSDGSRGRDGSANVSNGPKGGDGTIQYILKKEDGTVLSANQMYKLTLEDFQFDGMDGNGILEPGEIVTVNRITVRNNGQLPTPAYQKTKIYIANKEWVLTDGMEVEIPHSLAPGESYVLPESFQFRIKDTQINTAGVRFVADDNIEPLAHIIEVNRFHRDFHLVKNFQITFPVEISEFTGLRSLAPGEKTQVKFDVKNISTREIGNLSELKRYVSAAIRSQGGSLDLSQIEMRDPNGKTIALNDLGTSTNLSVLKPGESFTIQGTLEVKPESEPFSAHTLRSTLSLQHPVPARANEIYPIQNQDYKISVAQTFKDSSTPGILLVTNSETHQDEINAWKKLSKLLDINMDVWDASYYGRLPLLEDQNGKSLASIYQNKSIVILDNDWETADANNRKTLRNSDLLKKNEFLKASASYGINTMIVGSENSSQKILDRFYFPNEGQSQSFPSVGEFLKNVTSKSTPGTELKDVNEVFSEMEYDRWQFFGKPKTARLQYASDRLLQKLSQVAPDEQYVVAYNIKPQQTKRAFWGLFKKFNLGTIQVRRTLSRELGLAVSITGREDAIHEAKFVTSEENLFAFFTTLSADQRAGLMSRALTDANFAQQLSDLGAHDVLIKATIADVALQQSKASRHTKAERLNILEKIRDQVKATGTPNALNREILADFIAQLHDLSSSQVQWWMYLTPISNQRSVSRYLRSMAYDILEAVAPKGGIDRKELTYSIDQKRKAFKKADRANDKGRADTALKRYTHGIDSENYVFWDQVKSEKDAAKAYEVKDLMKKLREDEKVLEGQLDIESFLKAERCNLSAGGDPV